MVPCYFLHELYIQSFINVFNYNRVLLVNLWVWGDSMKATGKNLPALGALTVQGRSLKIRREETYTEFWKLCNVVRIDLARTVPSHLLNDSDSVE